MAHQEELKNLRDNKNESIISMLFNKLGAGGEDGQITAAKLVKGGKQVGIELKLPKATQMIAEVDKNGNGFINFQQFRNCMQKVLAKIHKDTEMYKKSFKKFDQDGNGFIDKSELRAVLCGSDGKAMSEKEAEELFNEADVDEDGQLSYDEFVEYFCKI